MLTIHGCVLAVACILCIFYPFKDIVASKVCVCSVLVALEVDYQGYVKILLLQRLALYICGGIGKVLELPGAPVL